MKTLIVMRHAKSSWSSHGPDAERPLNTRGRNSAKALGDWLRAKNLTPDTVLCSSAARTVETAERLSLKTTFTPLPALYLASIDQILFQIKKARGDTLLVVGHNPGIGDLAENLIDTRASDPDFYDYPTGATSIFHCHISDWSALALGSCTLASFVAPRSLIG